MIYLFWWIAIGVLTLIVVLGSHLLTKKKESDSLRELLDAANPDRTKLSYRLLNNLVAPALSFYVMPSRVVAEACRMSHQIWLQTPGLGGRPHGDSEMRRLLPKYVHNDRMQLSADQQSFMDSHSNGWMEQYRNSWHFIDVI